MSINFFLNLTRPQAEDQLPLGNQADGFLAVIGSGFRMNNSSDTGPEELRIFF